MKILRFFISSPSIDQVFKNRDDDIQAWRWRFHVDWDRHPSFHLHSWEWKWERIDFLKNFLGILHSSRASRPDFNSCEEIWKFLEGSWEIFSYALVIRRSAWWNSWILVFLSSSYPGIPSFLRRFQTFFQKECWNSNFHSGFPNFAIWNSKIS